MNIPLFTKAATSVAVLVFSTIFLFSFYLPEINGAITILLIGTIFLGIPHGALDIFLIQKSVNSKKDGIRLLFFYIVSILPMILAWKYIPTGAFLFFVLYSSFHFAQSDLVHVNYPRLEFWTRFLSIFSFPFTFHTEKFLDYASLMLSIDVFSFFIPVFKVCSALAIIGIFLIVFLSFTDFYRKKSFSSTLFLEPVVILILFFFLNPMYAFGIYFCFIHSMKHLVNVLKSNVGFSFKEILPYWIIPLIAMFVIVINGDKVGFMGQSNFLYASMIVISAIALPHAILVNFCKKTKLIN